MVYCGVFGIEDKLDHNQSKHGDWILDDRIDLVFTSSAQGRLGMDLKIDPLLDKEYLVVQSIKSAEPHFGLR